MHVSGQTAVENSLLFFGGTYEVRQDLAAAATTTKAYYAIGGQMIAVRTVSAADSTLHYILTDHLGSTSAILDESGTLINQQRYLPFGQPRADVPTPFAAPTDFGYREAPCKGTGQRDLSGTGLMDYRARFYSPYLSRFIQPDTLIPGAGDPQAWNRYAYVLNSPVKYNDPSGHNPCFLCTVGKAALVAALYNTARYMISSLASGEEVSLVEGTANFVGGALGGTGKALVTSSPAYDVTTTDIVTSSAIFYETIESGYHEKMGIYIGLDFPIGGWMEGGGGERMETGDYVKVYLRTGETSEEYRHTVLSSTTRTTTTTYNQFRRPIGVRIYEHTITKTILTEKRIDGGWLEILDRNIRFPKNDHWTPIEKRPSYKDFLPYYRNIR